MPSKKLQEFWILWNPSCSDKPPRVMFSTEEAARKSAEIMADRFCPDTFFVMKVVGGCTAVKKNQWQEVR